MIDLGADAQSLTSPAVIGRDAEIALIARVVERAASRDGGLLVLTGNPGIGKSRLCREAARRSADRGLAVLSGRAVDSPSPEPFRPLSEALSRAWRDGGPPDDHRLVGVRPTLAHLVPGWGPAPASNVSLVAISEALLRLLAVVAEPSGAALVLEDVHWADDETFAVLEYLADNVDAHGALVVATMRADAGPAGAVVRRLADRRVAVVLDLDRLPDRDVDRLVLSCLRADAVPEPVLTFVRTHAEGVPFFVEELLAGLIRSGSLRRDEQGAWGLAGHRLSPAVPVSLSDAIGRRFDALQATAQRVLQGAALLGRRFDWRLLPEVTGVDADGVADALRAAAQAGLVAGDDEGIGFRHALIRDRVLHLTLPSDQVTLGGRAIRKIEAVHPELPGQWCELVAELAELAGDRERAVHCLLRAARRARRLGALATARMRLEHARTLAEAGSELTLVLAEQLAEVLALAGDVDLAERLAAEALASRPGDAEPGRVADLELVLGRAALAAGRHELARSHAAEAARRAGEAGDPDRELRAVSLAALVAVSDGRPATASRLAQQVLSGAGERLPEVRCEAFEVLGRCARLHDVARAEQAFTSGLAVAEQHELLVWRARALQELGTIDLYDRLRTDRLEAARRAAVEAGAPATAAAADLHLAWVWVSRGRPEPGREAAERAVALSRRLGLSVLPVALVVLARAYAQERDRVQVARTVAEIRRIAGDDNSVEAAIAGHVQTMLALHEADRDAALRALDRATGLLRENPSEHFPHWGLWALMRTVAGDPSVRSEAAAAAGSDTRFNRALLHAAAAVVSGRRGDSTAARQEIDAAVVLLHGYEEGDWLIHLTTWLVAPAALADGWEDPVERVQAAVRWFGGHGYEPLARSCRALLRAARAPVPRAGRGTSTVPDELSRAGVTSREIDVLRLLGERLTNRAIAERLVLSPRTVEKHVASLLVKTGSADRTELAELATRVFAAG